MMEEMLKCVMCNKESEGDGNPVTHLCSDCSTEQSTQSVQLQVVSETVDKPSVESTAVLELQLETMKIKLVADDDVVCSFILLSHIFV